MNIINISNLFRRQADPPTAERPSPTYRSPWQCSACRFYKKVAVAYHSTETKGECRRHSPGVGKPGEARWPLVSCDDFCGEFKPASPSTQ